MFVSPFPWIHMYPCMYVYMCTYIDTKSPLYIDTNICMYEYSCGTNFTKLK